MKTTKNLTTNHTFVICAHGESPYLDECVRSVVMQTIPSEVILCTGTPNALISGIAEKYDIPLCLNPHPSDMQGSWNFGISCANTQFVTVCHQDDFYLPAYFEYVSKQLSDDVIMVHTAYIDRKDDLSFVGPNTRIKRLLAGFLAWRALQSSSFFKKFFQMFGNAVCCPTCTYNLQKTGMPVFTSKLHHSCDWDTYANYASIPGRIVYVPKPLFCKRLHNSSATASDIVSGVREREDYYMLCRFWPHSIAALVLKIYKKIYRCSL